MTPEPVAMRSLLSINERSKMAQCPVCHKSVDESAAKAQTGMTSGGAKEVDPKAGTRQFHDGKWYYFDTIECRGKFTARPDFYLNSDKS